VISDTDHLLNPRAGEEPQTKKALSEGFFLFNLEQTLPSGDRFFVIIIVIVSARHRLIPCIPVRSYHTWDKHTHKRFCSTNAEDNFSGDLL
jgi:hypothetical protein